MNEQKKRGGARQGSGRKKRTDVVINTTVEVQPEVIDKCRELHGSLANALRFASKHEPKKNKAVKPVPPTDTPTRLFRQKIG